MARTGVRPGVVAVVFAVLCVAMPAAAPAAGAGSPSPAGSGVGVPVYAYLYQWFEKGSWDRAKQDIPLVGKYSSDDPHVLRNQIAQAQWAGIDGFLTSWKHSVQLDRRLSLLVRMAALMHFDVGVVYEALDFSRQPLPFATVRSDLSLLVSRWIAHMHSAFGRPLIIWTGTNNYTHAQIAAIHTMLAGRAYLLAASKSVSDYQAVADVVDGEAYYWSSANPRSPNTSAKLHEFAAAVHARNGLWIAPAAPGFDGRALGHTRVIDRAGGSTFDLSLALANASSPDALGVISWNEWSENTYIEPGQKYGRQELVALHNFLANRNDGTHVTPQESLHQGQSGWTGLRAAGILVLLTGLGIAVLVSIGRRSAPVRCARNAVVSQPAPDDVSSAAKGDHRV